MTATQPSEIDTSKGHRDDQTDAIETFAQRVSNVLPCRDTQVYFTDDGLEGGVWILDEEGNGILGLEAKLTLPHDIKRQWSKYRYGDREQAPPEATDLDPDRLNLVFTLTEVDPSADIGIDHETASDTAVRERTYHSVAEAWHKFKLTLERRGGRERSP